MKITKSPIVKVGCPECRKKHGDRPGTVGVLFRLTLSRLEEGLGHEGFKCNACSYAVKYVPKR